MQNSDIWIRITRLYGSQTSPKVFRIQNSAFSTRIASLNGSQPSSVFFPGKTATFGSVLQVSMDPRPHLSFCVSQPFSVVLCTHKRGIMTRINSLYGSQTSPVVLCKQSSMISTRITSLYGSHPSSVVIAFKTAPFGSVLLVSMGPIPHLSFCA